MTVKDSVMVAEDLAHIAAVADCPPIEVTNTKIYARSFTAASPTPGALHIDRAAISDRKAIDATAKVIDEAIKMPVAMPSSDLRKAIEHALHR